MLKTVRSEIYLSSNVHTEKWLQRTVTPSKHTTSSARIWLLLVALVDDVAVRRSGENRAADWWLRDLVVACTWRNSELGPLPFTGVSTHTSGTRHLIFVLLHLNVLIFFYYKQLETVEIGCHFQVHTNTSKHCLPLCKRYALHPSPFLWLTLMWVSGSFRHALDLRIVFL
jgi:hypothetical protein